MATNTPALLESFDTAIAEKVAPFFVHLGALHSIGESRYDGGPFPSSLTPRSYKELDDRFFSWINRFVVGPVTFDITYGDREFNIEPMLYYARTADCFAPWELLSAANIANPLVVLGEAWVLSPDFVDCVIERMAAGLQAHWTILGAPTPAIIDRVRVLRDKRMLIAQDEQRRRDRERSSIQASAAFHAGRFAEAKALLEPFRCDAGLPPSAAKILQLAEQRLKGA